MVLALVVQRSRRTHRGSSARLINGWSGEKDPMARCLQCSVENTYVGISPTIVVGWDDIDGIDCEREDDESKCEIHP